jgi:hypothetical protein
MSLILSFFALVTFAVVDFASADAILDWNQELLQAVRTEFKVPTEASRSMAMVHTAAYDAVNAIGGSHTSYGPMLAAPPDASKHAAASVAAHDVLVHLFPSQQARFNSALTTSLAAVTDGPSKAAGVSVGQQAANQMIALRSNDGSNAVVSYTPGSNPGEWRPTPPGFAPAERPAWAHVQPFVLSSPSQFRPPPPPALGSPEYLAAFNEVRAIGAGNSSVRTPDQTQAALFWAYGGNRPQPNVIYNQVVRTLAMAQGNSLEQNARLFALVNLAQADAGIATWDAKYAYNFWRPVTAIQEVDPNWMPLGTGGVTPPHPAYVSGHSTFGGAVFETLANFYGTDDIPFTIGSDEFPGVLRSYKSFSAAADEVAASRTSLGIHWRFDNTFGQATGRQVADLVFGTKLVENPEPSTAILFLSGFLILLWRSAKHVKS